MEDYKKKYEEALKRAKDVYTYYSDDTEQLRKVESIFPELAESEDEKIRKGLIAHLKDLRECEVGKLVPIKTSEHYDAWLEKQGEQKETLCDKCRKEQPSHSCQDITELGRCALENQGKQKPVEPQDLSEFKRQLKEYLLEEGWNASDPIYLNEAVEYKTKRLLSLIPKHVEWSEEDEKMFDIIITTASNHCYLTRSEVDWLKSLRPQK